MKILYVTEKKRNAWNGTLHKPLQAELMRRKVRVSDKMMPVDLINKRYDAFFCDVEMNAKGWWKLKIPKIMFMEDVWMGGDTRKGKSASRIFEYSDAIMVRYKSMFDRKIGKSKRELKQPVFWLPHCIDPTLFKDWGQKKIYDTLSVGTITHKSTKEGRKFFDKLTRKSKWKSYRAKADRYGRQFSAKEFSQIINKSKITGTTNTIWQVLAKCMEIPASRSLLFCNYSDNMEKLGFVDDETYVQWDYSNLREKLSYYLKNPKELQRVTNNGYDMVMERHTIQVRADEWISHITDFVRDR